MSNLTPEDAFYAFYYAVDKSRRLYTLLCATAEWHYRDGLVQADDPTYLICRPLTNFSRHHSAVQVICALAKRFQQSLNHPLLVSVVEEQDRETAYKVAANLVSVLQASEGTEATTVSPDEIQSAIFSVRLFGDAFEWDVPEMEYQYLGRAGAYWFSQADRKNAVWSQTRDWWDGLDAQKYRRCDPAEVAAILLQRYPEADQARTDEARDKWCYEQAVSGRTYAAIARDLKKKSGWGRLSDRGVYTAARRFASRHGSPMPCARRPGRRTNY